MMIKSFQINMMKKLTFILLFVSTSFAQSKAYEFFNSFADIAEEVNESVVTITTTNTVQLDRDVQNFYRYWVERFQMSMKVNRLVQVLLSMMKMHI